jgi:hypothetical protein
LKNDKVSEEKCVQYQSLFLKQIQLTVPETRLVLGIFLWTFTVPKSCN